MVKNALWLCKKDDGVHINVAELDAVIKGVNLALKWRSKKVTLVTDLATVHRWLHASLTGSQQVKVSGAAEMLVQHWLAMVEELCKEYGLDITVLLVKSEVNKADKSQNPG